MCTKRCVSDGFHAFAALLAPLLDLEEKQWLHGPTVHTGSPLVHALLPWWV